MITERSVCLLMLPCLGGRDDSGVSSGSPCMSAGSEVNSDKDMQVDNPVDTEEAIEKLESLSNELTEAMGEGEAMVVKRDTRSSDALEAKTEKQSKQRSEARSKGNKKQRCACTQTFC